MGCPRGPCLHDVFVVDGSVVDKYKGFVGGGGACRGEVCSGLWKKAFQKNLRRIKIYTNNYKQQQQQTWLFSALFAAVIRSNLLC